MKKGKRYVESAKLVDRTNLYDVEEAVSIIKKTANAKFDETIEAHIKLGVDGRHADQQVRGAVVLPHGTGKKVRVLVFAKGDKVEEAQAAGADFVGGQELVPKIQNEGWLDFDVVVATPDMMGVVGRLGRVLGPKGLMPNPKAGTVTMDVTKAVNDIKGRYNNKIGVSCTGGNPALCGIFFCLPPCWGRTSLSNTGRWSTWLWESRRRFGRASCG